jgi:nucleoside-diphosphate-sugar epimerase
MRVLVTGGYGFIGSWIVRLLLERDAEVCVFDLQQDHRRLAVLLSPALIEQVGFVEGDIADIGGIVSALTEHRITHVVHLAGLQVPTCKAEPLRGARVNVVGTLALLEAIRQLQPQVQRLVYASSAAVFGPASQYSVGAQPDDARLTPLTLYGGFKVCNELNARVYGQDYGISSIGLRPWTVYGVGRDYGVTSEPTKAMKAVVVGRPYHISYGGWEDMQYIEDVAGTFVRCLEAPFSGAEVFNIRGTVIEMSEFHRTLVHVAPEAATLITHGDRQLPIAYDLDDRRLHSEIGEIPFTPLVEGIRRTIEQFRRLQTEGRLDTRELD